MALPLLPYACQAASQLQQWTVLDDFLCRIEELNRDEGEGGLQCHPDDRFFVAFNYVVSCLQRGEKKSFDLALSDARSMVQLIYLISP